MKTRVLLPICYTKSSVEFREVISNDAAAGGVAIFYGPREQGKLVDAYYSAGGPVSALEQGKVLRGAMGSCPFSGAD